MGIEPATFRILVQFLNQLYHRVQYQYVAYIYTVGWKTIVHNPLLHSIECRRLLLARLSLYFALASNLN